MHERTFVDIGANAITPGAEVESTATRSTRKRQVRGEVDIMVRSEIDSAALLKWFRVRVGGGWRMEERGISEKSLGESTDSPTSTHSSSPHTTQNR